MQKQQPAVSEASPATPEENLPVLPGANRIQWGRMGSALVACLGVLIASVLFESCR